jgi:hypothetical protein
MRNYKPSFVRSPGVIAAQGLPKQGDARPYLPFETVRGRRHVERSFRFQATHKLLIFAHGPQRLY